MPLTLPTDDKALQVAIRNCGAPADEARLVFINDTLNLTNLWVSPNMQAEVEANAQLSIVDEVALEFGQNGAMVSPWALT